MARYLITLVFCYQCDCFDIHIVSLVSKVAMMVIDEHKGAKSNMRNSYNNAQLLACSLAE